MNSTVTIGKCRVSRLCIGGNPFSGFSHQSPARDREMTDYFTPERICQTLSEAERAGINTVFARADNHILSILREYREQGGTLQWFAQVCAEKRDPDSWRPWLRAAIQGSAAATYIHGGLVDAWCATKQFGNFHEALKIMRDAGVTAGMAGHQPDAHAWIRDHLDVDFQMCSHYNPTDRSRDPHHVGTGEKWSEEDRDRMAAVIQTIPRPVVHYKVFAGGNKPALAAFEFLGRVMRPRDVVCIGFFTKDRPDLIAEDQRLFQRYVAADRSEGPMP